MENVLSFYFIFSFILLVFYIILEHEDLQLLWLVFEHAYIISSLHNSTQLSTSCDEIST